MTLDVLYSGKFSTALCMNRLTNGIGQPSRCRVSAMSPICQDKSSVTTSPNNEVEWSWRICHWFRYHKFYIRVQLVIWRNALPNTDHAGTWRLVETQATVRVALYRSIRWECRYRKNQGRLWSLLSLLLISVYLSINDVISSDTPGLRSTSQSHHLETGIRTSNM